MFPKLWNAIEIDLKETKKLQPLMVYYSINGVNSEKFSLTVYKHRRRHFKTSQHVKFFNSKNFIQF